MELLRDFKQLNKDDVLIAGGKGASLGEMTKAGIPVPPGFVILSSAFEKFLEATDLNVEINSILHSVDTDKMHSIEDASEKIWSLIIGAEMPTNIADEVKKFFKNLDSEYVAVRSSATAEDSASAAWAGQLESYLNTTEETLLENVKKCWASLFTPRAIFYRFEKGLHKQKISVAVVMQKMVESEKSGIAFSVHPVTQDKNQLIIEAGLGLGEAIVSGQITPDSYVVEKQPRRIIDRNLQSKKQVLSDKEISRLSKIILKIENHYGFPCDVEWVLRDSNFSIVQSRPITTLRVHTTKGIYKKQYNRSLALIECQYWDYGERIKLPQMCNEVTFFEPLFIHTPHKGTDICYNFSDEKQDMENLFTYLGKSSRSLASLLNNYEDIFDTVIESTAKKQTSLRDIFQLIIEVWPGLVILLADDQLKKLQPDICSRVYELRKRTYHVVYDASRRLLYLLQDILPSGYKQYANVILFEEAISGKLPTRFELDARSAGYIYFKGEVWSGNRTHFFAKHNFLLPIEAINNKRNTLKGSIAWIGNIIGKAKIVYEKGQMAKVKKGDILVTPMSTPDFLPAMHRAAAFVTDEGGITCHAAIVAREMQKPCIIGTKYATRILKDGDLVEVDAGNGIVKIL